MKMENQAWKGFHGGEWQRSIDVRSFIQKNWTPYEGDGSFLTGPTRRTRAVWERCEDLLRQELRKGVLDVETHIVSGIDSFAPGYIDRENEVIVGHSDRRAPQAHRQPVRRNPDGPVRPGAVRLSPGPGDRGPLLPVPQDPQRGGL